VIRRSRRGERRKYFYIAGGLALLFVTVAVAAAALYWGREDPEHLVDSRLCPKSGPKGHVVLLVDTTDPLNFTQKAAFVGRLKDLIEHRVPQGHLLTIFTLGEDFKQNAVPIVSYCNPGTGEDRSEWNANLKRLREQYETGFRDPMIQLGDGLVAVKPSKYSPIFEMLQLVGINGFQLEAVVGPKKLIVFSDMLHNTPQLSMFRGVPDFIAYEKSEYGRKTIPSLAGVEVELDYFMFAPQLQTKRNVTFWENLFQKAGARVVEVRPLEG
jgi:hypothetical protein